jgi:hypothetical protein
MKVNLRISEHVPAQAKISRPFFAWFLLLILLGASAVNAQTNDPESDVEPAHDLRTAIILAGYPCKSVVEFSLPSPSNYQVSCGTDRHYRVRISEEKAVLVDRGPGPSAAESEDKMDHDAFMKKQLVSIVNLAGHDCARALSYAHREPKDSVVTCDNQTVYRIQVTPEGRVAVEKQPREK